MNYFYQNQELFCEGVGLREIAEAVGTPVYVYSQADVLERARAYLETAVSSNPAPLVCFACKSNGNPALMRLLADAGIGADVTSGGELFLATQAGVAPSKIIYSGVGKLPSEIAAAIKLGIHALHVESEMEMTMIAELATDAQKIVSVGVRLNPDIRPSTHRHISTGQKSSKFGVPQETAVSLLQFAAKHPWLKPVSLAAHIGSQIPDLGTHVETAVKLVSIATELDKMGIRLEYLDIGGGLGIDYKKDWRLEIGDSPPISNLPIPNPQFPSIADWVTAVAKPITEAGYGLVMEPGRSIIGPSGALLTQVVYKKEQGGKQFVIVDAAMNDLLRPALYEAHHTILPLKQSPISTLQSPHEIVGPVCESTDRLAWERPLPPVQQGDYLAFMDVGAYGFAMSSNYNGRLRAAEVLVDGNEYRAIRKRQTYGHLLDGCDSS